MSVETHYGGTYRRGWVYCVCCHCYVNLNEASYVIHIECIHRANGERTQFTKNWNKLIQDWAWACSWSFTKFYLILWFSWERTEKTLSTLIKCKQMPLVSSILLIRELLISYRPWIRLHNCSIRITATNDDCNHLSLLKHLNYLWILALALSESNYFAVHLRTNESSETSSHSSQCFELREEAQNGWKTCK